MNKAAKILNIVGIVLGIAMILIGIIFINNPPMSFNTISAKDASFGADFYTYQYEVTGYAVRNTAVTANNIRELGEKIALYAGTFFAMCGAFIALFFGVNLAKNMEPRSAIPCNESGNKDYEQNDVSAQSHT